MATCIDYPIHDDSIYDGKINVKDFAILGFKKIDDKMTGLLYYFSDQDDKVYLIQNTFLTDEKDSVFLDAPINHLMNIDKLSDRDRESFDDIVNTMASNDCYYTSFKVENISDKADKITCSCTHTLDGKHHVIDLVLPFSIFVRAQIMKNRMIFNIPMNVFLDQDEKFGNIHFHRGCTINYFGCDVSGSAMLVALYILTDAIGKKIGLASGVPSPKKIVTTKIIKKETFAKLYPYSYVINMTKIIIMDWKDDDGNYCKRVCVYIVEEDKVSLYMMIGEPGDNILMKPYKMIFPDMD